MIDPANKSMKEAKEFLKELQALLPTGFDILQISETAKIPYKAYSWRGAILHRSFELGQCSIELYETNRRVSSSLVARALMETAGILFWMLRRIKKTIVDQQIGDIDDFFMRGKMGYRDWEKMPPALSVQSAIKHVDRMFEGYQKVYDTLSEFSHPNWSGTFGAFGRNIPNSMQVEFGPNIRGLSWAFIPASLCLSLMTILYSYEKFADVFADFTKLCEQELKSRNT